jgi:glycosyltransferase involved in cell wall biosynthesis
MNVNKTKIAIVLMDDIEVSNGTVVRVDHLLEVLHDKFAITVISCSEKDSTYSERWNDVRVINVGTTPLRYRSVRFLMKLYYILLWNLSLLKVLLKNRFDVVLCAYDLLGFPGLYLASKVKKFKVIYEAHSIMAMDVEEKGYTGIVLKLVAELEKFIIRHSDFVIALSINTMEFFERYNPNMDLAPVFIDTDIFHSNHKPSDQDKKLIGLIGPFRTNNLRQKHTLESLYTQIDKFDSRIRFLVIGLCDNRIEHPRIKYTGYLNSVEKYVDCLLSLDAVLVIETVASSGPLNKVIEPMSCSVPVFATPKAMIGLYWIEPGHDLLVFEKSAMASQINELIFNDVKMNEISKNAREKIERYYSKKANQEKLLRILQSFT